MANLTYIDDFINDGKKDTRSLSSFYDTMLITDVNNPDHIYRIPINDFFLKYKDELEAIKNIYVLSQDMFYKPKALSLKEYGTTEYWLAILRANKMKSVYEFHRPMIYMYEKNAFEELIKEFFKREGKL